MKLYESKENDILIFKAIELIGYEIRNKEPLHIVINDNFAFNEFAKIKINKKINEIVNNMIDLKVEDWHDDEKDLTCIHQYLGMTPDEYGDYLLHNIIPRTVSVSLLKDFVTNYHLYKNKKRRFF